MIYIRDGLPYRARPDLQDTANITNITLKKHFWMSSGT